MKKDFTELMAAHNNYITPGEACKDTYDETMLRSNEVTDSV